VITLFERFVSIPDPIPPTKVTAMNLATSFRSLANELEKLGETAVKGVRIDTAERKIVVKLDGDDPKPKVEVQKRRR